MADVHAVEIRAELRQVKSMVDHSFNVVLNVGEGFLPQLQTLMGWLQGEVRVVMVAPDKQEETESVTVPAGTKRQSKRATA